jgi:hypothetical protein
MSCGKSSLREDSGLFLPEFGYRRGEPFQQRFAAEGLRTVEFFDKKAGVIDIDFLLSRVNQPADIKTAIATTLPR